MGTYTGRWHPSEESIKQSNRALDATRYALYTEFGERAATEAYLAEIQLYVGMGCDREGE
jgi:hypothetical protein